MFRLKLRWLKALYISTRNWTCARSVIWVFLTTPISQTLNPGVGTLLRPAVSETGAPRRLPPTNRALGSTAKYPTTKLLPLVPFGAPLPAAQPVATPVLLTPPIDVLMNVDPELWHTKLTPVPVRKEVALGLRIARSPVLEPSPLISDPAWGVMGWPSCASHVALTCQPFRKCCPKPLSVFSLGIS